MSDENNGNSEAEGTGSLIPNDNSTSIDMTEALAQVTQRMLEMENNTSQQLQNLSQSLQTQTTPKEDEIDYYSDPDAYIQKRVDEGINKGLKRMSESNASQQAVSSAMAEVARDYPEINDPASAFYKEVDREFKSLSEHLKASPEGIRLATLQAASKVGLSPKSRRKSQEEGFALSGSKSGGNSTKSKNKDKDVSDITTAWSKLLGRNIDSPDYQKSIKEAVERDHKKYK